MKNAGIKLASTENGKPVFAHDEGLKNSEDPGSEHDYQMRATASVHLGPLPPPESFERYEKTLPGAAERILKLAEGEAAHRREMEKKVVTHNIRIAYTGQFCAFTLGIVGLCGGIYCVVQGEPAAGLVIAGSSLAGLIAPFLTHWKSQKN